MACRALALAILLVSAPAAAEWLQPGGSAQRDGALDYDLPRAFDLAFMADAPGFAASGGVVVIDDVVYFIAADFNACCTDESGDAAYLLALDLSTGSVDEVVSAEDLQFQRGAWPMHLASDGEQLYVVYSIGVRSFDLDGHALATARFDDGAAWSAVPEQSTDSLFPMYCGVPVVAGELFVACFQPPREQQLPGQLVVLKYDSETLVELARWEGREHEAELGTSLPEHRLVPFHGEETVVGMTHHNNSVAVTRWTPGSGGTAASSDTLIFDAATLSLADRVGLGFYGDGSTSTDETGVDVAARQHSVALPISTEVGLFLEHEHLMWWQEPTRSTLGMSLTDQRLAERTDAQRAEGDDLTGMSYDDGRLVWTTKERMESFLVQGDARIDWVALAPAGQQWIHRTPVMGEGEVLAIACCDTGAATLIVHDAATGERLREHPMIEVTGDVQVENVAFTDDATIVFDTLAKRIIVYGRTDASLSVGWNVDTNKPPVDDIVSVDLSDSQPGTLGAPTHYRVVWGDGTDTPWQTSPTFQHVYRDAGPATATFYAKHQTQSASATHVFEVGAVESRTWVQDRFAPENLDMTWGVIGVAIAASGGAWSGLIVRRNRVRLRHELNTVESIYNLSHEDPFQCDKELSDRRQHVHQMLKHGRLKEEQASLIERRIDQLARQSRLEALSSELEWLPHGVVVTLQSMLEDGRVSEWERRYFVAAIDTEDAIPTEQKVRVKDFVERWFARDSAHA